MKFADFRRNVAFGLLAASLGAGAVAQTTTLDLRSTVTGEPLSLADALPEGRDTPGVKLFLTTGRNPYNNDKSCLAKGSSLFLTACSGCHGHLGEGKIGPGLNDDYWTYPKNMHDQGLFETIFGGAQAQMGPHSGDLTLDELLQVMAWVRYLYKDGVGGAVWLSDEQKKTFKAYNHDEPPIPEDSPGMCNKATEAAATEAATAAIKKQMAIDASKPAE
ncbi:cytochrome c(L), periplasmic [Methylocella sp.]|uniref:cytochrome c(L), periplasmic n=1 Tax=Methylocella sp. TaxID=1978226 RepID=UPI0035B2F5D3